MVANRHCSYGTCTNDSRYPHRPEMKGVWWLPFPKPRSDLARCERWVMACGRLNFTVNNVKPWTYICSLHFVGRNGPTPKHPDPIPLLGSYQVIYF